MFTRMNSNRRVPLHDITLKLYSLLFWLHITQNGSTALQVCTLCTLSPHIILIHSQVSKSSCKGKGLLLIGTNILRENCNKSEIMKNREKHYFNSVKKALYETCEFERKFERLVNFYYTERKRVLEEIIIKHTIFPRCILQRVKLI